MAWRGPSLALGYMFGWVRSRVASVKGFADGGEGRVHVGWGALSAEKITYIHLLRAGIDMGFERGRGRVEWMEEEFIGRGG